MTPPKAKRNRNPLSFKTKMEIIRRLSTGEKMASLSRIFKINESSIRCISKNAEKIKASVANASPLVAGVTCRTRNPILLKAETALTEWIESQESEVNSSMIRAKALTIYEDLCKKSNIENREAFSASKGWYYNFNKRLRQQNIKENEPINSVHWDELKDIINQNDYEPHQIFNVRQTVLLWKRLPIKNSEFTNEKIRALLCNNIDGSLKCKPFVVHKSLQQIRSTKTFYINNKTGQISDKIFERWYINSFCKEVEHFCFEHNIEFKALLLLDNIPGYPIYLPNLHPNVKVLFLPMDITLSIQSMHQDIITIFKLNYIRRLITQMLDPIGDNFNQILADFTVSECLDCINHSWDETDVSSMNATWKQLCEEGICFLNIRECLNLSSLISEIVSLGMSTGGEDFESLTENDIIELLEPIEDDISDPKLKAEEEIVIKCEIIEQNDDMLDDQLLNEFFCLAENLSSFVTSVDPNINRSSDFVKKLRSALSIYRNNL